jgi:DNA-binding transcriptional LysR family regulator
MTLHQFEIFTAIAKYRNLSRASIELNLSQPSVSQQMKQLQKNYGARLFARRARGVELTDAGRRFLAGIQPILAQVARLKMRVPRQTDSPEAKVLVIAGTYAVSASLLPTLIAGFRKSHPRVEIDHKVANLGDIERLILKGQAEIGLTTVYPKSSQVAVEPYRKERLLLLVSSAHRLAGKTAISLREFQRVPLIIPEPNGGIGTIERDLHALEEKGLTFDIALRCEAPSAAKEAIARKVGLGIVYKDVAKDDIKRGMFKALKVRDFKLEGQTYIIYHGERSVSKPAREFLDLMRRSRPKRFREQGALFAKRSAAVRPHLSRRSPE